MAGANPAGCVLCPPDERGRIEAGVDTLTDDDKHWIMETFNIDMDEIGYQHYLTKTDIRRIPNEALVLKISYFMRTKVFRPETKRPDGTIRHTAEYCSHRYAREMLTTWKDQYQPHKLPKHQTKTVSPVPMLRRQTTITTLGDFEKKLEADVKELEDKREDYFKDVKRCDDDLKKVEEKYEIDKIRIHNRKRELEEHIDNINTQIQTMHKDLLILQKKGDTDDELDPEEYQQGGGVNQGELEDYDEYADYEEEYPVEHQVAGGVDQGEIEGSSQVAQLILQFEGTTHN